MINCLDNGVHFTGSTDRHLIGVVGTGLIATAHGIRMQQIERHALNFFRDAEVALEGKFHAAGRADAGGNTFIARIQNVAIGSHAPMIVLPQRHS